VNRRAGVAAGISVAAVAAAIARRTATAPVEAGKQLVCFADLDPECFTVETDDGAELQVAAVGPESAPLVILAHCWMGTQEYWGPVAAMLVDDGFRVVAYDHRGHGRSTNVSDPITIDRLGSDLVAVLDHVATPGAVLVGHSMGGMAIQAAVVSHPRILDELFGIVLVSTSARPMALRVPGTVADRILGESASARIARRSPTSTGRAFGPGATAEQLKATNEAVVSTPGATRAECLVAISHMDLRDRLGHLAVPTRVVVGSHDRLANPAKSRQLTDLIRGAQMSLLDGVGHMVPLEAPDAVVAAVRSLHSSTVPSRNLP
jgi:pimeloyl-ACP methyl ester carboxylesterase